MNGICFTCGCEFNKNCEYCNGRGVYNSFNQPCFCCQCGSAKQLFNEEGIIISSPNGIMLTNQTGGICCNHPVVRGFFQSYTIPQIIKDAFCNKLSLNDCEIKQLNDKLCLINFPYRILSGEEAWVYCENLNGNEVILTWENSD